MRRCASSSPSACAVVAAQRSPPGATGASRGSDSGQHHGLAAGGRAVRVADVVAAANKAFEAQHPGVKVNVEYQQWNTHLQKFDATLAGGNVPDVIEMGNTEMTKYMAAGAFADITASKSKLPNSVDLAQGPAASGPYKGKLNGVPYYAGSRVVIYRTDLFKRPASEAAEEPRRAHAAGKRLSREELGDKTFSPVYIAGKDWYSALGFVYDYGGKIATPNGNWTGALDSPAGDRRAERVQELLLAARGRASRPTRPARSRRCRTRRATRRRSSGPAGSAAAKAAIQVASWARSRCRATPRARRCRGSSAAPTWRSRPAPTRRMAVDWIAAFTDNAPMRASPGEGTSRTRRACSATAHRSAPHARSWFVPTAKNWTNVESANMLRTMLTHILTNKLTDPAGGPGGEQQHHAHPQRRPSASAGGGARRRVARAPLTTAGDAAGSSLRVRRHRPSYPRPRLWRSCRTR